MPEDSILCSVCFLTYNHEGYVEQALRSAAEQEVDFGYEVVVGDDCSTDETAKIVRRVAAEFPDRIRVLERPKNLGARLNGIDIRENCRGKYIAWLEGDDYWTDLHKIQKQVTYLESHPEAPACFHPSDRVNSLTGQTEEPWPRGENLRPIGMSDLLVQNLIQLCSVVARASHIRPFPDWMLPHSPGDWGIFLHLSQFGDIGFLPDHMSMYRIHEGGTWSQQDFDKRVRTQEKMLCAFLENADFSRVGEQCHDIAHILRKSYSDAVAKAAYRRLFLQNWKPLVRSGERITHFRKIL